MRKLLFGFCTVGLLASSLAQAEEHEWTNKQGKTIKAGFVSAGEEAVTISMKGKTYVVKLADLSPQSRALAAKLRVQKSTAHKPGTAVDFLKLQDRNGVKYLPNEDTPFTGRAAAFMAKVGRESNFKDGKLDGLTIYYNEVGQKWREETYKDGKLWTAVGWKPNGERSETNVVKGNGVVIDYNDDGTEKRRDTFKDGVKVD